MPGLTVMGQSSPLSATTRLLGFAGLVPQFIALLLVVTGIDSALGALMAFLYAAMILSFIGGIWWGFSVAGLEHQGDLSGLAVVPTIVAGILLVARLLGMPVGWALVAIGSAILMTLIVDRRLVENGRAPRDWMMLRVPLSVMLGAMTILAGILAPHAITISYSAVN